MSGGQTAIRGFLVQALSALLTGFHEPAWSRWGATWSAVEFEPVDADEKVDIRWTLDQGVVVEQVKSTAGAFALADVRQILLALVRRTPGALVHRLQLIGACTGDVADLAALTDGTIPRTTEKARDLLARLEPELRDRIDSLHVSQPAPAQLRMLMDIAATRLEAFLGAVGLDVPKLEWRLKIVEGLCTRVLALATKGTMLPKGEFENLLRSWIRGIRDELKLFAVPERQLLPQLTFSRTREGKTVLVLRVRAIGSKTCVNVAGRWKVVGRHVPYLSMVLRLSGGERHFGAHHQSFVIDPGASEDVDHVEYHPDDIGERVEVEVGAQDVPRRLFYWEDPLRTLRLPEVPRGQHVQREVDTLPFSLASPIRPLLFGEAAKELGLQTGWHVESDPTGTRRVVHRFKPPEG